MGSALTVIVPSRGRPAAALEVIAAFTRTVVADTRLVVAVDNDDPTLDEYTAIRSVADVFIAPAPSTMVATLNAAALHYADDTYALGFMGDDHRPRTLGWDQTYLDALRSLRTGIVYGDDLLQGERIPTQVAMTADIVHTLGHMAPPGLKHLFVDNYWRDLGKAAGCLTYLPHVIVEHLHPYASKANWDEGYMRVNHPAMYAHDQAAYGDYVAAKMDVDIERVRSLR